MEGIIDVDFKGISHDVVDCPEMTGSFDKLSNCQLLLGNSAPWKCEVKRGSAEQVKIRGTVARGNLRRTRR